MERRLRCRLKGLLFLYEARIQMASRNALREILQVPFTSLTHSRSHSHSHSQQFLLGRWLRVPQHLDCDIPVCSGTREAVMRYPRKDPNFMTHYNGAQFPWIWTPYDCYHHMYSPEGKNSYSPIHFLTHTPPTFAFLISYSLFSST